MRAGGSNQGQTVGARLVKVVSNVPQNTLLIEQGENLKYIQSQLGHSSPTVTLNVYAHLMKPTNQEAARRLEEKIFGTGDFLVTSEKSEETKAES